MSTRRGLKGNPFEIGERVYVWGVDKIATVLEVIYPERPRGRLKYRVSILCDYGWDVDVGIISSTELTAVSEMEGHENE